MPSITGSVSINTAPAVRSLQAAARAMENVEKAGKDVTVAQRAAMTAMTKGAAALAAENRRAAESFAKIGAAAIKADRDMRNADLNASNKRKNDRAKTAADVGLVGARTDEVNARIVTSGDESAAKVVLANARAATEEVKQRIALENSASAIASRSLRDQIALRNEQNRIMRQGESDARRAAKEVAAEGKRAANEAKALKAEQTGQLNEARYVLGDVARGITVASVALAAIPVATAKVAISWEKDFANVVRTVGVTGEGIDRLKGQFVALATTMPVTFGELSEIGTLAGQLGIAEESIGSFTRTVAMFASATGVSLDESATAFGRLNSLVPDVQGNFTKLGDAILKVGVNSVATEQSIIRITTQIAATASGAGFTSNEIIGLSGALASIGVPPELSRGVITRAFGDITKATSLGGIELENWGAQLGMSGAEFKKAWADAPQETFSKFLASIREEGGGAALALNQLGITSVRDVPVLTRLANAADSTGKAGNLLAESIDNANNSAGEMERQYSVTSGTVAAKIQILIQSIQAIANAVGETQLDMFGDILDDVTNNLQDLALSLDENVKLFGMFELDMTNADFLAFAAATAAIVAAVGLAVAGIVKLAQAFVTLRVAINTAPAVLGALGLNFGDVGKKAEGATKSVGKFGGAMAGLGRSLPIIGLAVAAAVTAFEAANNALDAAGSTADDSAGRIQNFGSSAVKSLQGLKGDFLSGDGFKIFESTDDLKYGLDLLSDFDAGKFGALDIKASIGQLYEAGRASDGIRKLSDGYKALIDSGNGDKVVKQLNALAKEAQLTDGQLNTLVERGGLSSFFKGLLRENGIEITTKNLAALARDGLAGVGVEADDAHGAVDEFSTELTELQEAAQASIGALAEASGGIFDFAKAIEDSTSEGSLSIEKFMESIRKMAEDQKSYQSNLGKLSAMGLTGGFLDYLASLGPTAAPLIAEFVANPAAFAEAQELWKANGADSAAAWASSFKERADIVSQVGAEFGQDIANQVAATFDSTSAEELPRAIDRMQNILQFRKLYPQASYEQLQAAADVELPAELDRQQAFMVQQKLHPQATLEDVTTQMNTDLPRILGENQMFLDRDKLFPKASLAEVQAAIAADLPGAVALGNQILQYQKLFPKADMSDAEATISAFVNRQRVISIQVRATMPDLDGAAVSGSGRMGTAATGGAITGPGTGTSDSIPYMLSNGEHVMTAREVQAAGGQNAVYALRRSLLQGNYSRAAGGPAMNTQQMGALRSQSSYVSAGLDAQAVSVIMAVLNRPLVLQADGRTIASTVGNGAVGLNRNGMR